MHFTSQVNPKGHPFGENFSLYYGTAPDERFLAVRAGDSRAWNLVDFLAYLIG